MNRSKQMKLAATTVRIVCRFGSGQRLMQRFQTLPLVSPIYRAALGYHRPFASLSEANLAIMAYAENGHENPYNALLHLELSKSARASDYAALFHLQNIIPVKTIFDLGGNVGNLFYCYSQYLNGLSSVLWRVLDMQENVRLGEKLASERGATQLSFTMDWQDANGTDLLIVSGSLHYFERPVAEMVNELSEKPRYILINRTPLVEGASTAMVQDAGKFRVACMLHNRQELIRQFTEIGYVVVDQWSAPELSLNIPGYPDYKVSAYSGMFLSRQ